MLHPHTANSRSSGPDRTPGLELPAMRLVPPAWPTRRWVTWLIAVLCVSLAGILQLPWQQTARGRGRVIAWSPVDRPQTVDAPIAGRVMKWYVLEGTRVRPGDPLVELQNNDPDWLSRLEEQRLGYLDKVTAAGNKVAQTTSQIASLVAGREQDVASAEQRAQAAEQAVTVAEQALAASRAVLQQAELNRTRQQTLEREGITSQLDQEIAQRVFETARADAAGKQAALREKEADLASKRLDVQKIASDDQAKIDAAGAYRREAEGELAVARAELAKITSTMAQQQSYLVRAPRAGTVFRLRQVQGTAQVKETEPLVDFVPDTETPVVELLFEGIDVPLVLPGQRARLQFEGWPAVQLAGWPSVAMGTFGGVVKLVDATDSGKGQFRVVVEPDRADLPWPRHSAPEPGGPVPNSHFVRGMRAWFISPQATYLRQGVRAEAWVQLNRVPLWFEFWRRLNGFPPVVASADDPAGSYEKASPFDKLESAGKDKKTKPPLPK